MIEKQKEQLEALEGLNKHVIDSTEKRVDKLQAKYKEIAQNMGLIWDEIQKQFAGGMDSGPKPKDPTGSEEVVNRATQNFDKLKGIVEGLKEEGEKAKESMVQLDVEGLQRVLERTEELKKKFQQQQEQGLFGVNWDKVQKEFQKYQLMVNEISMAWSAYSRIRENQMREELQQFEQQQEQQKESVERRLKAGIISEKEAKQRKEQLEEELNQKKAQLAKEQAEREKSMKTFQAIIDTAAAIIGYLAKPGGLLGVALSAMAAATGAAQVAAIQSQPVPKYAEGGRVKKNQVIEVAEGDKEEGVLSNKTLTDPETAPMANYLLDKQAGISTTMPDNGAIDEATDYNNYKKQGGSFQQTVIQTDPGIKEGIDSIAKNQKKMAENQERMTKNQEKTNEYISDPKNRRAYISTDIQKNHEEEMAILEEINTTTKTNTVLSAF
jgi:hypothetical protein